ncbi:MAG: sugar phosphate isomerase/epimerase family protein [Bryobacteraceae bacterium]
MSQQFPLAAITDEFSPEIEKAIEKMAELGMTGAELRMVFGKNIIDLTGEELARAKKIVSDRGLQVISIASPLLKVVLPDAPEVDARFQQDSFNARHTIEDQPRLAERAFEIAKFMGARIIRVFSFWRVVEPEKVFDRVTRALGEMAERAAKHDLIIGIENEHACNIATGAEAAQVLNAVKHPNLRLVWDPANARVAGELRPFPDGYNLLPKDRIYHVHAKDVKVDGHKANWLKIGDGDIDWKGQVAALAADGYKGYISLETHWPGPGGDKFMASTICSQELRTLVNA